MVEHSKEERVRGVLSHLHLCKQCTSRVFTSYFRDYTVDEVDDAKPASYCCACLGILEESTLFTVARDIARRMEECDTSTFHLGISVPHCLILRHSSLRAHIDSQYTSITTVKTVAKVLLTKLLEKFTKMESHPQGKLAVQVDFNFAEDEMEFSKLLAHMKESKLNQDEKPSDKPLEDVKGEPLVDHVFSSKEIQKEVKGLTDGQVKMYISCPPQPVESPCTFTATIRQTSIVFGGRYNKYSRELFQTPRSINGVRIGETSVMELIGEKLKEFTGGEKIKIKAVGHEAYDVRMLGEGRPFALEVSYPKRTVVTAEELAKLEIDINSSTQLLAVRDLKIVNKASFKLKPNYKQEEVTYKAKLWCPEYISDGNLGNLNEIQDIEIKQKTPIRILHTGCVSTTEVRMIREISLKRLDEGEHYEVTLKSQGGTYIKEFFHGDFGRTEPSLRTLLHVPIDIVELDIVSITSSIPWPQNLMEKDMESAEDVIHH